MTIAQSSLRDSPSQKATSQPSDKSLGYSHNVPTGRNQHSLVWRRALSPAEGPRAGRPWLPIGAPAVTLFFIARKRALPTGSRRPRAGRRRRDAPRIEPACPGGLAARTRGRGALDASLPTPRQLYYPGSPCGHICSVGRFQEFRYLFGLVRGHARPHAHVVDGHFPLVIAVGGRRTHIMAARAVLRPELRAALLLP